MSEGVQEDYCFSFSSFETIPGLAAKLSRACPLSFRRRLSFF